MKCIAQEEVTTPEQKPPTAPPTSTTSSDPLALDVDDLYVKYKVRTIARDFFRWRKLLKLT